MFTAQYLKTRKFKVPSVIVGNIRRGVGHSYDDVCKLWDHSRLPCNSGHGTVLNKRQLVKYKCDKTNYRFLSSLKSDVFRENKLFKYLQQISNVPVHNLSGGMTSHENSSEFSLAPLFEEMEETEGTQSPVKERRTLDQVVCHMQLDIRRKRRIHKAEIHNAVDLIEKSSKTDGFGEFLLNCCCDVLADLHPTYRIKLAQRIWSVMQKSGEASSPEAFEAMSKSLAINEDKTIDPFKLLEEAKKLMEPTPVMYFHTLLISCQRGDIEAAVKLLSFMKEKSIFVNENYFNALIIGKGRSGDVSGAEEIVDIMRTSQIEPSNDTWKALLQVYIEAEDIQLLRKTFSRTVGAGLSTDQFYELLKVAGRGKNQDVLDIVIHWAFVSKKMRHISIINIAVQLIHQGHCHNALKLVLQFNKELSSTKKVQFGAFFIKELNAANDLDPEIYLDIVMSLQEKNKYALNIAAEWCFKQRQLPLIYAVFEGMSIMGVPIRPHYFLSPMITEMEQNGVKGIIQLLMRMQALNVKPDWEMLLNWIFPLLMNDTEGKVDATEALSIVRQGSGLSYSSGLLSASLAVAVEQGKLNEVIKIVNTLKGKIHHPEIILHRLALFATTLGEDHLENRFDKNFVAIKEILLYVIKHVPKNDKKDYFGAFIMKLIKSDWISEAETTLSALKDEGIAVSEHVGNVAKEKLNNIYDLKIDKELQYHQGFEQQWDLNKMGVTDLESHKDELETKNLNTRGILRKLFLKYCQTGDFQNAMQVKQEFENKFEELSPGMKSALLEIYVKNKDLTAALQIYNELTNDDNVLEIDSYKFIDFATLLIKNGRVQEGMDIVENQCLSRLNQRPETFSRNIVRLLTALSQQQAKNGCNENVDNVFRLTNLFLQHKLLSPTNPSLVPSIKDLLIRGKLEEAVERLESYTKKYQLVPCLQELTYATLNKPLLLHRIVECSTAVKGLREAKRLLALAKSDIGDLDGAAAIFQELGEQLSFISIIKQCEYLASRGDLDKLLNVISSLQKTGRYYNYQKLYEIATNQCKRSGDRNSANKILSHMQENDQYVSPALEKSLQ